MRYALLIHADPSQGPQYGSDEHAAEMQAYFAFNSEAAERGVLRAGEALQPVQSATTVRVRDGQPSASDGSALGGPESLGGYYVIDVEDRDAAIAWAAKLPPARYGSVEVRPLLEIPGKDT